jgi:hypothetical protein
VALAAIVGSGRAADAAAFFALLRVAKPPHPRTAGPRQAPMNQFEILRETLKACSKVTICSSHPLAVDQQLYYFTL